MERFVGGLSAWKVLGGLVLAFVLRSIVLRLDERRRVKRLGNYGICSSNGWILGERR